MHLQFSVLLFPLRAICSLQGQATLLQDCGILTLRLLLIPFLAIKVGCYVLNGKQWNGNLQQVVMTGM